MNMPTLPEIQRAVQRAIIDGNDADAAAFIVADGFLPSERLNVYRNTFIGTLTTALRLSHPATHKLVGDAFFETAAAHFISERPPTSAYLNEFGCAFAEFLARFQPAASLPYLPDVARLEWAVNRALHASDAAPIDLAHLSTVSADEQYRLRFIPHPSVTLVCCDYPVDLIWRAVLTEDDAALASIDLNAGKVWLLVERTDDSAEMTRLTEAAWRFAADIFAGHTLQAALDAHAGSYEPDFLASHLTAGRFRDFAVCNLHSPIYLEGEVA